MSKIKDEIQLKKEKKEIEDFIGYAHKKGFVDDSAEEWSDEEKRAYYYKCLSHSD